MRKSLIIGIIVALILLNITLAMQWFFAAGQIKSLNKQIAKAQSDQKIIAFTQLLTDTVLNGDQEISFEDRLDLEKSVRDLNDQEIFDQWQKFTKSSSDQETQKNFTDLIKLLLLKVAMQENPKT